MDSKHWICERCGEPASVCHHKTYLTAANVNQPEIAFNFDNLECLCKACHDIEHEHFQQTGAVFTSKGDIAMFKEPKMAQDFKAARDFITNEFKSPPV